MSGPVRLAAYSAVLVLVFAGGWTVGSLSGLGGAAPTPLPSTTTPTGAATAGESSGHSHD